MLKAQLEGCAYDRAKLCTGLAYPTSAVTADVHGLQVLVLVLAAVLVLTWFSRRIGVASPIVLLLGGMSLAFVPWADDVRLPPDLVLLLFLPALLYGESLNVSLREFRANVRMVALMSILLAPATTAVVAVVGHVALGLSWPVAWVLGAVVAPTDATALSSVATLLPRRILTVLRGESLINDSTAVVVLAITVPVATGAAAFSWGPTVGSFAVSYLGGAATGLLVAWLVTRARKIARDRLLEIGINALAPFVAFLVAEQIRASGALAVVVCGLVLSHVGPRIASGRTRMETRAFWQMVGFLLNGALFVLVGMQLRGELEALTSSLGEAVRDVLLVSAVVIATRIVWWNTVPYVIRALDRRPQQRYLRIPTRHRVPVALAASRGGVSLAAALSVPAMRVDGSPFPDRELIIIVTFGVILVTLLLQSFTLPAIVRWARLPADDTAAAREQLLAERAAVAAGLAAVSTAANRLGIPPAVADRVRAGHEDHLQSLDEAVATPDGHKHHDHRLRAALLPHKRAALIRLRDSRMIDDVVLRRVQSRLDAEEIRLSPPHVAEAE